MWHIRRTSLSILFLVLISVPCSLLLIRADAGEELVSLVIESWRTDDADAWRNVIIPAFERNHKDIKVFFRPTAPLDYNATLNAKLSGNTAGDLITCRPFDASLQLYEKGHLLNLNRLAVLEHFPTIAKSAWQTDDGSDTYCMPIASVIHGFLYNKAIFSQLTLKEPTTVAEFFKILEEIARDGRFVPLAIGTRDQWEVATMGFQNIGPNYWKGEEGRLALIRGTAHFSDPPYIAALQQLADWRPYLGEAFQARSYADSQSLFALGRAAVYPTGSWDIATFRRRANFEIDAFPPPLPSGASDCFISDHTDIGMGINANTKNQQAAILFIEWVGSAEFADLYANSLPGFFPLSDYTLMISDPLAQKFLSWREKCKSTIRNAYQILSRGTPNLENEIWNVAAQVVNGTLSPENAAKRLKDGLSRWFKPIPDYNTHLLGLINNEKG